jgi:hypothetical protein
MMIKWMMAQVKGASEGRREEKKKKKSRPSCSILPWFRHCGLEEALGKHHFE